MLQPNPDSYASFAIENGLLPEKGQSKDCYFQRIEVMFLNDNCFSQEEIACYLKKRDQIIKVILEKLDKKEEAKEKEKKNQMEINFKMDDRRFYGQQNLRPDSPGLKKPERFKQILNPENIGQVLQSSEIKPFEDQSSQEFIERVSIFIKDNRQFIQALLNSYLQKNKSGVMQYYRMAKREKENEYKYQYQYDKKKKMNRFVESGFEREESLQKKYRYSAKIFQEEQKREKRLSYNESLQFQQQERAHFRQQEPKRTQPRNKNNQDDLFKSYFFAGEPQRRKKNTNQNQSFDRSSIYQFAPQEIAQSIIMNVPAQPEQTEEQYQQKARQFIKNNPHLRSKDIQAYEKDIEKYEKAISVRRKQQAALFSVGAVTKWARTALVMTQKAAEKAGAQGVAQGWVSLVKSTATIPIQQLAKTTFTRVICSRANWIITGLVCAFEVGQEFQKWNSGQITGKQFFINSGKILVVGVSSVAGGAGGAAVGVAVGAIFGPVGAIVGGVIGGVLGAVGAGALASYSVDKIELAIKKYTSAGKLRQQALDYFELLANFTEEQLEAGRKAKYTQYHPDLWANSNDEALKKLKAENLLKSHQYYEILISSK